MTDFTTLIEIAVCIAFSFAVFYLLGMMSK